MTAKLCMECYKTDRQEDGKCSFCRYLYEKDYARTYPSRRRLYSDLKKANTPKLSPSEMQAVNEIYATAKSLTLDTGVEHHVDHIVPISKGGLHVPENLRVVTAEANLKKHNKHDTATKTEADLVKKDLTDEEIMILCKSLANRYRNPNMYEDLVSEGLVACYEVKAAKEVRHKADYVGAARRAMNDFINIKSKAVSIPASWHSRSVSHALATGEDLDYIEGVSDGTFRYLYEAMANDVVDMDKEAIIDPTPTTEHMMIEREEREEFISTVLGALKDDEEIKLIRMRYYEDKTQDEVAEALGISTSAVSQREKKILKKLNVALCNNLLLKESGFLNL